MNILGYSIYSEGNQVLSKEFSGVINTINPHSYLVARKDERFRNALLSSEIIIPDGIGFVLAARILSGEKIKKISGYDLHEEIINKLDKLEGSCFYLGSSQSSLEKIKEKLSRDHPSIRVESYSPPFKTIFSDSENLQIRNAINKFNPDVLFVGMTAPKQEKWVYDNRALIKVPVICSIGAAFDFYSGKVKRSGKFWIAIGLEWLPRLIKEPLRLWNRTFISAPQFLLIVFCEKVKIALKSHKSKEGNM